MANATTQFGGFLTNVGIAQQANTAALGLPWNITHMLIGDAGGEPSQTPDPTPKPTQNALVRQVYRAQLNALYQSPADPGVLVAELVLPPETGGWWIRELALEDANGNFIAVAKPAPSYKPLLAQGSGRTQTIRMHVVFGNLANVTLKVDPSIVLATRDYVDKAREAAELYARNQLKAHVEAADPHPQYLRRADVGKDAGPLAWLGAATGTADALVLKLKSSEAVLTAYAAGQRFQFQATATNTGALTARINGLAAVAVKKSGGAGLVDLVAGDVRAGALYDLNYDGTYFQLGGGVGGSKAFERFSFEASIGQTIFNVPHTVGNTIVLRNGREVTDYLADGQKITFRAPCSLGEAVEILAFSAFQAADTYTKAEMQALLNTASALPVGAMLPFPKGSVPAGFLEVDGSVQSAAVYPDLATYLGGAFDKGDEGAGNFRLPDSRGEFLRGWDHGRGVDLQRTLGSTQPHSMQSHNHEMWAGGLYASVSSTNGGAAAPWVNGSAIVMKTGTAGGDETRPRNLAVMWCLKAWNAPVNQGQLDVAALVAELTSLRSSTPVGAIMPFPTTQVPPGYLELDGSVQSASTYPDLATYLGTTYNKGDEGAGNFRLPDYRGEFLRGWDHGRGVDVGRAIGSKQAGSGLRGTASSGSQGTQGNIWYNNEFDDPGNVNFYITTATGALTSLQTGVVRPRNLAVMWCIKAWNAPVNQGHIDVAALAAQVDVLGVNGPVIGTMSNAAMTVPTASASGTFTADEIVVGDSTGRAYRLRNFNQSINLASVTKGLGAMDAGSAPASGVVALYALYNPEARQHGLIAVNATGTVAPNLCAGVLPAGYTASALVSVWSTTAAGLLQPWAQRDRFVTSALQVLNTTAITAGRTPLQMTGIPLNARRVLCQLGLSAAAAGAVGISVASSQSGLGDQYMSGSPLTFLSSTASISVLTPGTIYYTNQSNGGTTGFTISISRYEF
ncbi:phage tail protein [Pseudomonas sp. UFMG81]|uniref:phage tail protein n=1 Tax=Pseudomonas sp. UFMG81 TaxID=2745936 RepID=UPI001E421BE8|nr:phage tail protein [Pseudomonas sp. UFMG81]